ncbi:MAG: PQQ-binding-like beta-propeller repeat protein [Myxococcales bacterium]|nr:PQQ-binding-like beta-propeller repeat protein [Myxococcales bacterium]
MRSSRRIAVLCSLMMPLLIALGAVGCADGEFGGELCPMGHKSCGNGCTELASDPRNCGQCGVVCAAGQICCNSRCLDQTQDNCGDCGNACGAGTFCELVSQGATTQGRCEVCDRDDRCGTSCAACSGTRPRCVDGKCAECSKDEHCDSGKHCEQGVCAPCNTDAKCGLTCKACASGTFCDGSDCVTCDSDKDCGPGKRCDVTVCKVCNTHEYCGANCTRCTGSAAPYCNAAGSACATCGNDSHCQAGQFCDPNGPSGGECVACTLADHCGPLCAKCTGSNRPHCSPSGCAECLKDSHCPSGQRCAAGSCVPCNEDAHCGPSCAKCEGTAAPYCNKSASGCVQCTLDAHCSQGKYCTNGSCKDCSDSAHCGVACVACGGATPYCNAAGTGCVACTSDSHCGTGTYCKGGSCAPCNTDAKCGQSCATCASGKFCNGAGCVGCCGAGCAICQPGQYCDSSACKTCNTDDHCGASCVACGGSTPYCKGGASCVQCQSDGQCPTGSYCAQNQCKPCDTNTRCGPSCGACASGQSCCGASAGCAALLTDKSNCGKCGRACSTFCNNGLCDASVKCSLTLSDNVYSTPAVDSSGTVYVATTDGKLRAVSPSCQLLWTATIGNYTSSSPVLSDDEQTVYLATTAGPAKLWAYITATGAKLWDRQIGVGWSAYNGTSLGAGGVVYAIGSQYTAGDYHETLQAIDSSGGLLWSYDLGATGGSATNNGAPAIAADGTLYALSSRGVVHAVSASGSKKWSKTLGGGSLVNSAPAISGDGAVLIANSGTKTLYKLSAADGSTLWQKALGTALDHSGPISAANGDVYLAAPDGRVRAYDKTGAAKWTAGPAGCYRSSAALGSDDVLYAINGCDGSLKAIDAQTGQQIWSLQVASAFASSPTLSNDGILWVGANKTLWAVTTGAASGLAAGWPKRHRTRANSSR